MEMKTPIAQGRRIGFDYGEKRIGVATSDSESILVSPHATINNDDDLSLKIGEILNDVQPVYIVIGNQNTCLVQTAQNPMKLPVLQR